MAFDSPLAALNPLAAHVATDRVIGGVVVALIGLGLLVLNRRVSMALLVAQREGIGALLGSRRGVSDRIQTSPAVAIGARIFVGCLALFFVVGGIGVAITPRH